MMFKQLFADDFCYPIADSDTEAIGEVPVLAIANATVVAVGKAQDQSTNGYGNHIVLRHDLPLPISFEGQSFQYFHSLSAKLDGVMECAVGQSIKLGQQIGVLTGPATSSRFHFELAVGALKLTSKGQGGEGAPFSFIEYVQSVLMAHATAGPASVQKPYLGVDEVSDIVPFDRPMANGASVPAALEDIFFHQPEPDTDAIARYGSIDAVPEMKTFAVLDAAQMPYLLTGLLETSGLRYQSLFQGAAQAELEETAPYLVELKENSQFSSSLFMVSDQIGGLWGKDIGVFIRARTSFDTLRKHLRKFTRIQDTNGKWFYFKFWDSKNFYATSVLRHDPFSPLVRVWLEPDISDVLYPAANSMGVIRPLRTPYHGFRAIRLRDVDIDALRQAKRHKFLHRVMGSLKRDFADLWATTSYDEVEAIYTYGCARKYTIEKAAYDFIRSQLLARQKRYVFDQVESYIDPDNSLAPLIRGKRIWAFLEEEGGL